MGWLIKALIALRWYAARKNTACSRSGPPNTPGPDITGAFTTRAENPIDAIPEKPGIILESAGGPVENGPPVRNEKQAEKAVERDRVVFCVPHTYEIRVFFDICPQRTIISIDPSFSTFSNN